MEYLLVVAVSYSDTLFPNCVVFFSLPSRTGKEENLKERSWLLSVKMNSRNLKYVSCPGKKIVDSLGQQDSLVGKDTCCQDWQPEISPQEHDGKKKPTPMGCPLTSTQPQ